MVYLKHLLGNSGGLVAGGKNCNNQTQIQPNATNEQQKLTDLNHMLWVTRSLDTRPEMQLVFSLNVSGFMPFLVQETSGGKNGGKSETSSYNMFSSRRKKSEASTTSVDVISEAHGISGEMLGNLDHVGSDSEDNDIMELLDEVE